jgi:hypothetical protein
MAIGDPITQPIPPVGTAGTGYASQLVALLTEIKARLEAKVAFTSLVASLFDLSNNGIANVKYVGLYEQLVTPATPVGSLQRYGGELYYVSPSGAVRITNGGTLDAVSLRGITGTYAAPAEFRYDLPSLEYYAYSNQTAGPKEWARIAAQGYDIYGSLTGTTRVRISWAGGANPSYTLTLPATVPGSTSVIQMDNAGNLTASNTIVNDMTMTVDKNIILSGTGRIKHGSETRVFSLQPQNAITTSGTLNTTGGAIAGTSVSASCNAYWVLPPISNYETLVSVRVYQTNVVGGSPTYVLASQSLSDGTLADFGPGTTSNAANFLLGNLPSTMNNSLFLHITTPAGVTLRAVCVEITVDVR